jgi:hypothetical protein
MVAGMRMLAHYRDQPGYALLEEVETEDGRTGMVWVDYTEIDHLQNACKALGIDADLTYLVLDPAQLATQPYDTAWTIDEPAEYTRSRSRRPPRHGS